MNKTLLQLVLLSLAIASAWAENSETTPSSTNPTSLRSSKSGILKIFKDERGFYALADFKYDSSHANDTTGDSSYPMMLGLYTSQSVFATGCLNFEFYDCPAWKCSKTSETITKVSYPFFNTEGYLATASAYLEYSNWALNSDALLGTNCFSGGSFSYGQKTYGILGMGFGGTAQKNFLGSKIFSISLQKDRKAGQLLFKEDFSYATSSYPILTITTDDNWKGNVRTVSVGNSPIHLQDTSLIFDVNSDTIGLPVTLFEKIMDLWKTSWSISCSVYTNDVTCNYNGYLSNLPKIILSGDSYTLAIFPDIYVQGYNSQSSVNSFTLNMRPLASTSSGRYYVSKDYENYVILGSNVMSYYYTVFDSSNTKPSIRLFYAKNESQTPNNPLLVYIVGGIVALVIIALICKNRLQKSKANTDASFNQPFIRTDQGNSYNQQYAQQPHGYIKTQ